MICLLLTFTVDSSCTLVLTLFFSCSQKDKRTGRPKIWIYRDKSTNVPKGDATVTYEDPYAASAAVEWFNNKDFHGSIISVFIAETKSKEPVDSLNPSAVPRLPGYDMDPLTAEADSLEAAGGGGTLDNNWSGVGGGRGRGPGEAGGKAWQQEGDWLCPNPRSVMTLVSSSFETLVN